MNSHPNLNNVDQHYLMGGTVSGAQPQQQQQQLNLLQEQEYQQLLFNQQQYLNSINMPMIYNQNLSQQTMDMQALQRQQLLQVLTPQNNQIMPNQAQQQHQFLDQHLAGNPMAQHLQQQLYVQQFQATLQQQQQQIAQQQQRQQPPSQFEQLATLQNGQNLLNFNQQQPQQQQQLYQKVVGEHSKNPSTSALSSVAATNVVQQQQQHPQQFNIAQQQLTVQQLLQQQMAQQQNAQQQSIPQHLPQQQQHNHYRKGHKNSEVQHKIPPVNTNLENARLLKEREEESLQEKREQEAREKQRIQVELKRRKDEAKEFADSLAERIQSFPEPLHLATCHTLSKVSLFLPFPMECAAKSSCLPCFDLERADVVFANSDSNMAQYLSEILVETTDELKDIELIHQDEEPNDIDADMLNPLIQSILNVNGYSFSTDSSDFQLNESEIEQAFDRDIQEAVKQVTANEDTSFAEAIFNQQQTSSMETTKNIMEESSPIATTSTGVVDENAQIHNNNAQIEAILSGPDQTQLRKQMLSLGKQPKSAPGRKKRDMVESLYDSLTGYFDPSKETRRRGGPQGARNSETDESAIDALEEPSSSTNLEGESIIIDSSTTPTANSLLKIELIATTTALNDENENEESTTMGRFFDRKTLKKRKPSVSEENRPTTPTEIIKQRESEWHERQLLRKEKIRRRQQDAEPDNSWNNHAHESSKLEDVLIERFQMDELRLEAQKLKGWSKMHEVAPERICNLLTVLEKNVRDVLNEDGSLQVPINTNEGEDEADEVCRELMDDRLIRSVDAACTTLIIMTSPKVAKQVLIEDSIERSIQLAKQYLDSIIFPAADSAFKSPTKVKKNFDGAKRKRLNDFGPTTSVIYSRIVDLIGCFAELARFQTLNETVMFQLSSLSTPLFFVDNILELQLQCMKLLPTVFSKCESLRRTILTDLVNSLHRLPSNRNNKNSYRLGSADKHGAVEFISNLTALVLQLIQSMVKLPPHKKHIAVNDDDIEDATSNLDAIEAADRIVMDSYDEAKRMAGYFLERFLSKCTAKSEDDFRRIFDQFLQDVLAALHRPEWPVAELILTVLAGLLVIFFRDKKDKKSSIDIPISLRVACLDYLGTITARLRKDRVADCSGGPDYERKRLDLVVKGILYDEFNDMSKAMDEVDISYLSSNEKLRKLEQALIDYILGTKGSSDFSVEYVLTFYAAEWYRGTVLDLNIIKNRYNDNQRKDKKLERVLEKGSNMKEFILNLMDKKHLKKRVQYITKTNNIMLHSDAYWVVKYLGLKKDLNQSLDNYLNQILNGFHPDYPVAIRTKAMKCLSQIVEGDHNVLIIPEVNQIVKDRLVDVNAAVREATFELIGRYLVARPDLLNTYYQILLNRIKDTAIAVRKRVIRILKDIVEKSPNLEKKAEILARIIQRINDEEGVRKLCLETFQNLWFTPNRDYEKKELKEKIISMADTVDICVKEGLIEQFETLVSTIFKNNLEKATTFAAKQIIDALVDSILSLDSKIATDEQTIVNNNDLVEQNALDREKLNQARLMASLTTLSVFAKARPELLVRHADVFVPYLSISVSTAIELKVLNQMISMLELIVPLIEHPSEIFLMALDSRLNEVVRDGGMVIIASAIACMSAAYDKFKKIKPGISNLFLIYLKYLSKLKDEMETNTSYELNTDKRPTVMRSLYTLGLMCRYFDFDDLLNSSTNSEIQNLYGKKISNGIETKKSSPESYAEDSSDGHVLRDQVFQVLLFFSRSRDHGICQKALIALGQLAAGCSELLTRDELRNMYLVLLNADRREYLSLKVQVLKNLSCFLNAEEMRAMRNNEKFRKEHVEEKDDLKEMELSSSGLSSSVIQVYWNAILNCYFHTEESVRMDAAQVVWQTLEQGLVTPGSSIPTLIAMSTDPLPSIRIRIENLIKDIDTKYTGMIASKAIPGVRMAFRLQTEIRKNVKDLIRGLRQCDSQALASNNSTEREIPKMSNDIQALLSGLYASIRTNRQQRRSFLSAILRLFSENNKVKLEIEEWIFVADNLAHFSYQVMDEPLYVIHQADSIISISGQNILSSFKRLLTPISKLQPPELYAQQQQQQQQMMVFAAHQQQQNQTVGAFLAQQQFSTTSFGSEINDDDDDFTAQVIFSRLPEDKTQIYELKKNSQACFILLHLKFYLMKMYGFKEDKLQEYSPSDNAKIYDKPLSRRNIATFSPDSAIRELSAETLADRDTVEGHFKLAEHFHNFFKMLLSLDKQDDDDDLEPTTTTTTTTSAPIDGEASNDSIISSRGGSVAPTIADSKRLIE